MKATRNPRQHHYIARFGTFLIAVALVAGMVGCGTPAEEEEKQEIQTWYDLDAIRNNPGGTYSLGNDLDSTTPGYLELASSTANGGKGWEPIGVFGGIFDGQGYEICDLFIDDSEASVLEQGLVALFSHLGDEGIIKNIGVADVAVTSGRSGLLFGSPVAVNADSLVAVNDGTVSNSYATGSVAGENIVGGLVAWNEGTLSDCYATCTVTGQNITGGLLGYNAGNVSNCCFMGNVTGFSSIGGLLGWNTQGGIVSNSYATGSVTATGLVGGLVGLNDHSIVRDSCSTGRVIGVTCIGGLVGENYGGTVSNSYSTGSVNGQNRVGGLTGDSREGGSVSNSFWDTETSMQSTSAGGTGKTTEEMTDIATYMDTEAEGLDEAWDIIAVDPGETNETYIWNMVDGETYPFLSWESVV